MVRVEPYPLPLAFGGGVGHLGRLGRLLAQQADLIRVKRKRKRKIGANFVENPLN